MRPHVCLLPNDTLHYPKGGGHLWVYLNWALGLQASGYEVTWLEVVPDDAPEYVHEQLQALRTQLSHFGLERVALVTPAGTATRDHFSALTVDDVAGADLLLNLNHSAPQAVVQRFRRSALVDIDPGLLQVWMATGDVSPAVHDVYFSIGETVGQPGALFPDGGIDWHYTPPPVFLPAWPVTPPAAASAYTTVSHWWYGEMTWRGETFNNDKRASFLDYVTLPAHTNARLELALCLGEDPDNDRGLWRGHGWHLRESWDVTGTADAYRCYVQQSRGEFSCAKPSCMHLQNAWVSDRTICYLASGHPVVVQDTGPSRILPRDEGMFRFNSLDEAAAALERVEAEYERHARAGRALAERHFDAVAVTSSVVERALS